MVMDEVWLALCFGLKEQEEGFINAYTCPLPACTGDASLSERNKNKPDVCFVFFVVVFTYHFQGSGCCHLGLIVSVWSMQCFQFLLKYIDSFGYSFWNPHVLLEKGHKELFPLNNLPF